MIEDQPGVGAALSPNTPELAPYAAGTVRMISAAQMDAETRRKAELSQKAPAVQELAAYVRNCWAEAQRVRTDIETRMMQSLRQRRGEYEPDKLTEIRKQGGSEIYMMLTSVKCRAAASWLRDSLMGQGSDKPWTLSPTPVPELPEQAMAAINNRVMLEVQQFLSAGGLMPTPEMIENAKEIAADRLVSEQAEAARKATAKMEKKMEDQLVQGGFREALDQFIDDLTTYPAAFLKGPVVRNRPKLEWSPDGQPVVSEELKLEWERVNPLYIYPAPQAEHIDDGYLIERHRLSRSDISALLGVEGYDDASIRMVLQEYGRGGLNEWLSVDAELASTTDTTHLQATEPASATIDALQFWGDVPGRMLIDWGIDEDALEDRDKDYAAEVWLIGNWVIKASLNSDPLRRRPYYKASYEEIPGEFWGHSVADLVRDTQNVCNAAARSLVNNMGIASGPQAWVNVDRLPPGEDITQMYPWKIWQGASDPYGNSGPPVGFFQPHSMVAELMGVYEKFSQLADEYSGVPKYMTGTEGTPGAGRTASGLSMMINNAGKAIKQVLSNVDVYVITPLLEMLYYYNLRYSNDPELKMGDINIKARGASGLVAKEAAQVRMNEFMNLALSNPAVQQIIGPSGIAELLRAAVKQLDIDTDEVVPSEEMVKAQQLAQQQAAMAQQQMMAAQAQQPVENINFQRGPDGEILGAQVIPGPGAAQPQQPQSPGGNGQQLMDGAPVTDLFQPAPGGY